ncbi:MAG: type IV pilus biogenesis/stability protein PilW [Gammaproteobacteria bacterium]|nr:type IV pilus biogenesis/stability protein PilW [Gammaproteobacteria bacterium]
MRTLVAALLVIVLAGCSSIENYKNEQAKNERLVETQVQLGVGYYEQGNYEVALEKLQKALELKSDYGPAHSAMALVYEKMQKYDKADEHYREAIDLSPEDGGIYNNYGVFLCKRNRAEEAEKYFIKAIQIPLYATPELAYENAGACARRIPDSEKAERYLNKALELNPNLPTALINMAEIRFAQERFLSSRGYLQRYEAVSPHSAESLWLGIRIERKLGDKNAEANYKKQLQTKFPKSEQFRMMLNSLEEDQS